MITTHAYRMAARTRSTPRRRIAGEIDQACLIACPGLRRIGPIARIRRKAATQSKGAGKALGKDWQKVCEKKVESELDSELGGVVT